MAPDIDLIEPLDFYHFRQKTPIACFCQRKGTLIGCETVAWSFWSQLHECMLTCISTPLQAARLLAEAKAKYMGGDKLQALKIYEDVMFQVYAVR